MPLSLKLPRRNSDAPRPSFRERTAALKASAAKVIGKKPGRRTPPKPVGAGEPSPGLAAVLAAHEQAYGYALYTEAYGLPDIAERRQAEEEAFRALLHSPLHSDADRAAYAAAVISRQSHRLGDTSATERDHPLAVAFRNISYGEHAREPEEMRHVGRPSEPEPEPAADPILAAIAASYAATAAFDAFEAAIPGEGVTLEQSRHESALCEADVKAQMVVWRTVPTTPAGRHALVRFALSRVARVTRPNGEVDDAGYLFGLILDAFAGMVKAEPAGAQVAQAPAAETTAEPDVEDRARMSAEQIDLTALDVFQLSGLFEAFQVAKFTWEGVAARPYAYEVGLRGEHQATALAEVAEFEERRAAWIMDRLEREIANRKPEDGMQRDEILMVRTQQEFMCNRRIHDNALLLDITRAWIV